MPSLAAALIASIAGWVLDAIVSPFLGITGRILISIVVTTYIYVYARNWLRDLRG
ncbi:MAG TPA: hypothetical protein VM096_08680 [Vicinamibacterales bacterium]|nr:hypothetical protein [Vicinamibacterales bacterium]